ncbi:MAG: IS607 family transposase [Candidatus Thorarchaeota archaeon]|nr:IS607 family transposase [Candidatus Thorarchaeota archaeon]
MFSVSQAALRLAVCVRTLHRWDKLGRIQCSRTVGGHQRISLGEVNRLLGSMHRNLIERPSKQRCAIYARVSSHLQKYASDLDRQLKTLTNECRERFRSSPLVFTDVGFGLNMKRKGLAKLFRLAKSGSIHTLLITHRDRLVRFGLELLEGILNDYGVKLLVIYQPEQQTPQEELVTDMMALIASFSGRVYGLRTHQSKHPTHRS